MCFDCASTLRTRTKVDSTEKRDSDRCPDRIIEGGRCVNDHDSQLLVFSFPRMSPVHTARVSLCCNNAVFLPDCSSRSGPSSAELTLAIESLISQCFEASLTVRAFPSVIRGRSRK